MPYLTEVSIILPCFNGEKFIFSTIESIKNQVFKNWECIIIDDKSSDNSFKIIKESINNDKRFYLISNKTNLGVGKSRNIGIKKSKGRYITFIDSDDLWLPKKLLNHLDFIKKNKLVFSHASYGYINSNDKKINYDFIVSKKKVYFKDLLKRTEISCLTAIYDSEKIGKFYMSEDLRRQDYFLWLNILKKGHFSLGFNKVESYYRLHSNQKNKNLFYLIDHFLFLKRRFNLNYFESIYYTIIYALNGLKRYYLNIIFFKFSKSNNHIIKV